MSKIINKIAQERKKEIELANARYKKDMDYINKLECDRKSTQKFIFILIILLIVFLYYFYHNI